MFGLFLYAVGPNVQSKLYTWSSLSPSLSVLCSVSLTRLSGSFLLFKCTLNPLPVFSVFASRAFRYLSNSFQSAVLTFPNHFLSGSIRPAVGSVGLSLIFSILGFYLYMLSRFIVALSLNWEPFLPPEGSGLLGLVEALLCVKADPFFPVYFALKALPFL